MTCLFVPPRNDYVFSRKIPRAKALVRFWRYRAAQEAARYEERLKQIFRKLLKDR